MVGVIDSLGMILFVYLVFWEMNAAFKHDIYHCEIS